jgi:hypothetical protein
MRDRGDPDWLATAGLIAPTSPSLPRDSDCARALAAHWLAFLAIVHSGTNPGVLRGAVDRAKLSEVIVFEVI